MRPSGSTLFVAFAMAVAGGVGLLARSASGSEDSASASPLPSDAARFGFLVPPGGSSIRDVALLDATREFRIELTHGPVRGSPPATSRLVPARTIVTRELGRYPAAFLRRIRLRGVVFTDDLCEGETPIPSLPNVGGLLLLDVAGSESDLVRGLHHEVFHFADLADDGTLTPDPAWERLNVPGFVYGAGGRTLRSAWAARPPADDGFMTGGFVSPYATSGPEEDKAETFAFAMARPQRVRELAAQDAVVAAKLDELARRLATLDAETARTFRP